MNFPSFFRAQQIMMVSENYENILTKENLLLWNEILKNITKLR